ncbi:MAG TPA: spermidine synthase-like protein, partial [Rhodocyclaceae bacterium]
KGIDLVLVDAFDTEGFAPALSNREFLETAHAKLSGSGMLVINLAGDEARYAGLVAMVMDVFDSQVIVIAVREDDNHVLLAFKERDFTPDWRRVQAQAKVLRSRMGLDFPLFAQMLERSMKLGVAEREALRNR